MIVHTFAFRWKAGVTDDQKLRAFAEIRGLQGQIPGLVEALVGCNVSPRSRGYELGGVMKFTDRAALDVYGGYTVHRKLLQSGCPRTPRIGGSWSQGGGRGSGSCGVHSKGEGRIFESPRQFESSILRMR